MTQFGEFWTAMIQGRHIHRPQHPVGHVGRSWNLEKMPSSMQCHLASFPGVFWFAGLEYHYSTGLSPARLARSIPRKVPFALQGETRDARQSRASHEINQWRRRGPGKMEIWLKNPGLRRVLGPELPRTGFLHPFN